MNTIIPFRSAPCPSCGGTVTRQQAEVEETYHAGSHVAGTPLPTRRRLCSVAACNECEFVVELRGAR
jgi:hypothetical protein